MYGADCYESVEGLTKGTEVPVAELEGLKFCICGFEGTYIKERLLLILELTTTSLCFVLYFFVNTELK